MKKRGPNPKIFLILTILTLLAGSALAYMQYSAYAGVKSDVQTLKATSKDPVEVQKDLDDAIVKLNDTRSKLTHLEMSVPEMAYVPTLLKELEKLGKECGIEVNGVRPVPISTPPPTKNESGEIAKRARKPYNELDIEVRGRGSYTSVMKFIEGLTTFPKIVAARTISMQPKAGTQDAQAGAAPKLDVTINLRTYLFPTDGKLEDKDKSEEEGEKTIDISAHTKVMN